MRRLAESLVLGFFLYIFLNWIWPLLMADNKWYKENSIVLLLVIITFVLLIFAFVYYYKEKRLETNFRYFTLYKILLLMGLLLTITIIAILIDIF